MKENVFYAAQKTVVKIIKLQGVKSFNLIINISILYDLFFNYQLYV